MTQKLSCTLKKTMNTIQKKIEFLEKKINNKELSIVELEKSLVIQYLDNWNNHNNSFFYKNFNVDDTFFENVTIFFIPKNKELTNKFQIKYNVLFCLDGDLVVNHSKKCESLTALDIKNEEKLNVLANRDSYVLMIK